MENLVTEHQDVERVFQQGQSNYSKLTTTNLVTEDSSLTVTANKKMINKEIQKLKDEAAKSSSNFKSKLGSVESKYKKEIRLLKTKHTTELTELKKTFEKTEKTMSDEINNLKEQLGNVNGLHEAAMNNVITTRSENDLLQRRVASLLIRNGQLMVNINDLQVLHQVDNHTIGENLMEIQSLKLRINRLVMDKSNLALEKENLRQTNYNLQMQLDSPVIRDNSARDERIKDLEVQLEQLKSLLVITPTD